MKIHSIQISNYKGIKDSDEIIFQPNISILCGRNNCGKTSVLDFISDSINDCLFRQVNREEEHLIFKNIYKYEKEKPQEIRFEIVFLIDVDDSKYRELINSDLISLNNKIITTKTISPHHNNSLLSYTARLKTSSFIIKYQGKFFKNIGTQVNRYNYVTNNITLNSLNQCYQIDIDRERNQVIYSDEFNEITNFPINMESYTSFNIPSLKPFMQNNVYILQAHRVSNTEEWVDVVESSKINSDFSNYKETLFTIKLNEPAKFHKIEEELRSIFPEISNINIKIKDKQINVFLYNKKNDCDVSINNMGTGVEQLLGLITAIVSVETKSIFLIDEPHVFLHPYAERGFMNLLSKYPQHQYILATHSSIMINSVSNDAICLLEKDSDDHLHYKGNELKDVIKALELKPGDLWLSNAIIWVDGETEEAVLPMLLETICPEIHSSYIIKKVFATSDFNKGDAKKTFNLYKHTQALFTEFDIKYLFIFDSDETNKKTRDEIERVFKDKLLFLKKREIENYFLDEALILEVLEEQKNLIEDKTGLQELSLDILSEKLKELLNNIDDNDIYCNKMASADKIVVKEGDIEVKKQYCRGSNVLNKVFNYFFNTKITYDKKVHGKLFINKIIEKGQADEIFAEIKEYFETHLK